MPIPRLRLIPALLACATAFGQPAQAATDALNLSLEDLMQVVVTSVSKKSQTLSETAAAVHVITAEDIRRSGAASIPEALRLAPGVQVSAIGNNKWAVSIRGFADRFANKLLVLVDGRSVYTPLFSGVLWETLDVPLENIARIEVMRGPGAAIWGANAVNGVINIITKSAFDVQGGQVVLAAGSELEGLGFARYGWSPDPDTAIALHAQAHATGSSRQLDGDAGKDDWQTRSAGFKVERLLQHGTLLVEGGLSHSQAGDEFLLPQLTPMPDSPLTTATQKVSNSHLMARWEDNGGGGRQDSLQLYLEHSNYQHEILAEKRTTADLEYQQRHQGTRHDMTWGVGYRYSTDQIGNSSLFMTSDRERATSLFSLFALDEITLAPERWRLSLGARLEHNDYTDFVFQPNLRLLWNPEPNTSAWLSVARAVRTPSRMERGGATLVRADSSGASCGTAPLPCALELFSRTLDNETVDALDLGWRKQLTPAASLDLAAFYYHYEQLRGAAVADSQFVVVAPGPVGYILIETEDNNANSADVYGLEASLDWRVSTDWRLQAQYSWLQNRVHTAGLPGQAESDYTGVSPSQMLSLRSSLNLTPSLRWDAWLRHTSRIRTPYFTIPAYTTLDMRLAWQAGKDLEVALVGQNLLDSAHPEFGGIFLQSTPSEIERGFYASLNWKF